MSTSSEDHKANEGQKLFIVDDEYYIIVGDLAYGSSRGSTNTGRPNSAPNIFIAPFTIKEPKSDGGSGSSKLLSKACQKIDNQGFSATIKMPPQIASGIELVIQLDDCYITKYLEYDNAQFANITLVAGDIKIGDDATHSETWSSASK